MGMDFCAGTYRHEHSCLLGKVFLYIKLSMQIFIDDNSYRTTLVDIVRDHSTPT